MTGPILRAIAAQAWRLAESQHWVVSRSQLLELGISERAIEHRLRSGRLFLVFRGVYVVGRRELSREGWWMAALLACGVGSVLSHFSAAELLGLVDVAKDGAIRRPISVTVPARRARAIPGIEVHRRAEPVLSAATETNHVPHTSVVQTLVDCAAISDLGRVEAMVNAADREDLIDPEALRRELDQLSSQRGIRLLRKVLNRSTFRLTDSELERLFLPLARQAGLPVPQTRVYVSGYRVDFFWQELGMVVETDGPRYHRSAAAQTRDRRRDQAHTAAGLTPLRFTHWQVAREPTHIAEVLAAVAARLRRLKT